MDNSRVALLIDSDNVSAKYINCIIDELTKYGSITVKRIYGDWTDTKQTKWKEKLLTNSINPIQQFTYTTGKNATDSSMIIDAMDLLYSKDLDVFCIVSSDSDFTRLASRLRESGKVVVGMGEGKTPEAFKNACSVFTNIELLLDEDEDDVENSKDKVKNNIIDKVKIERLVKEIVKTNQDKGKETDLGEVGQRLVNKYPNFDVRNYGYSLLSKFIEEVDSIKLIKGRQRILVEIKDDVNKLDGLKDYMIQVVQDSKKKEVGISELSNTVRKKYKNFSVKDYGYSTFSKLLTGMKTFEIVDRGSNRKSVKVRK